MRSLNLRSAVFIVLALAGTGLASAQAWREAPAGIKECERTQGKIVCATWVRTGDGYSATWPDGNVAKITLGLVDHLQGHFGAQSIRYTFIREDQSGPTAGLKAIYECELHKGKKVVSGWKVWKVNGKEKTSRWTGVILDSSQFAPNSGPNRGPNSVLQGAVVPVGQNNVVRPPAAPPAMPAKAMFPAAVPSVQTPAPAQAAPRPNPAPAARTQAPVHVPPAARPPVAPAGRQVFRILIPGRKPAPKPEEHMPFEKWISCPEDHTC